jgi:hypothetical protein
VVCRGRARRRGLLGATKGLAWLSSLGPLGTGAGDAATRRCCSSSGSDAQRSSCTVA